MYLENMYVELLTTHETPLGTRPRRSLSHQLLPEGELGVGVGEQWEDFLSTYFYPLNSESRNTLPIHK